MIFCFLIKSYDFWLINYFFGFNIIDNGIMYYNFDIESSDLYENTRAYLDPQ